MEVMVQGAVLDNGRTHRRLSPIRRRTLQKQHVPEPNMPLGQFNPRLSLRQTRYALQRDSNVVHHCYAVASADSAFTKAGNKPLG